MKSTQKFKVEKIWSEGLWIFLDGPGWTWMDLGGPRWSWMMVIKIAEKEGVFIRKVHLK